MKRNIMLIVALVIILLAVAALFGWQTLTASAATTNSRIQTVTVQRGTLVANVSAAGNVSAPEEAAMAFQTSGRIAKVNVQVGDVVRKGQVLMELDTADLELALRTAQANLASAQANYDSIKIKTAQNPNELIVAKAALDKATVVLQQAQSEYDKVAWRSDVGMTSQAATLQQASIDYQSVLANYQIAASGINDTALKQAQAQFDSVQIALEQAQHNLDTQPRIAQASLDNAQVAVDQAQLNLDKAKIVAPFDGMVAAVNYSVGDTAGSSTAVSIVDLANLQVKVMVAEVDMSKIKVGETAQMTLDALPGNTYNAQVIAIGPVGTVTQGVVNYPVTIAITDADSAIKPGMTANLAVVVDQRNNVLMVPTRAVRTAGNQKVVTVLYKGQSIQTPVSTGLTNDQSVEITNGLQEGDVVVINQTQTRQPNVGGGFGIPGFGG
jgi:HlyD family secretion protein